MGQAADQHHHRRGDGDHRADLRRGLRAARDRGHRDGGGGRGDGGGARRLAGLSIREPRDAWTMAAAGLPADFKTSMLQSLEQGSITEVDCINGAVVRGGRRHGVPTPVNDTLVALVKSIERRIGAGGLR